MAMGSGVTFEVLGPLRVMRSGASLPTGGRMQERMLALLLAAPNTVVPDDVLIEEAWRGDPPKSAPHLVQVYMSRIRDLLPSDDDVRIAREHHGYRLEIDENRIDGCRLARALHTASTLIESDPEAAERVLEDALEAARGRPFGDLGDDMPTVRMESDRLAELVIKAREDHIRARLNLGHHADVVPALGPLIEQHPFRERLWAQLMIALYRSGREAEALRTYARLRRMLGEELGIEPSAALQQLEERILLQDPELSLEASTALATLPTRLTSFVGRAAELVDVGDGLRTTRLMTLTGVGGIGKTRLAIETARRALTDYPHGVAWADLAVATDPAAVVNRVAAAVGVRRQPGVPLITSIARAIRHRKMLLVIDNCEQVADSVGAIVADLLSSCDRLRILATSRVPLEVAGEVLWSVPPLGQPADDPGVEPGDLLESDAASLFVERARAANRTFDLGKAEAAPIATLCRRLDGLPLAIEMAAAQVAVLAPAQIVDKLEDRFELLRGPRHPGVPRHETLQAAIDWSYSMLAAPQRLVFERVAVFAGPFDLEAAAAVAGEPGIEVVDAVRALSDSSLISVTQSSGEDAGYRLLETIREYAIRKLDQRGEVDAVRKRHATHYLSLLRAARPVVVTPEFSDWMKRLDGCHDEINQALDWLLAHGHAELALSGAPTLFHFWYRGAHAEEAGEWGRRMLAAVSRDANASDAAAAHNAVAFSSTISGDFLDAAHHSDEAMLLAAEAEDLEGLILAQFTRAQVALAVGDFETMFAVGRQSLALSEDSGNHWLRCRPLSILAFANWFGAGDLETASTMMQDSLPLYRELDDRMGQVGLALTPLCSIALQRGDVAAAERYALEAVAVSRYWDGSALSSLGDALGAKGDSAAAIAAYQRALVRSLEVGLENWFRVNVRKLSVVAASLGLAEDAARFWGASLPNMPQWGAGIGAGEAARTRDELGPDRFDELATEGTAWDHREVVDRVRAALHV